MDYEELNNVWVCYLLKSTTCNRTYIGATNNFKKRIRQHNGEIKGGAKYTHSNRPWKPVCLVYGFKDNSHALCFEWRVKRKKVNNKFKTVYLKNNRIKNFFDVLQLERFTKKCELSSNYNFTIKFFEKVDLNNLNINCDLKNIDINYNEFIN
jgi:structure-specific endonuclease subunit SLX1